MSAAVGVSTAPLISTNEVLTNPDFPDVTTCNPFEAFIDSLPQESLDPDPEPTIQVPPITWPDSDPQPQPTAAPTAAPTPTPSGKQCDPVKCAQWKAMLRSRSVGVTEDWQLYQIRQAGPSEYNAVGGGVDIWADGIRVEDCTFIEAKHVSNPGSSPYIPGSAFPEFLQGDIALQITDEVFRYTAIINDPSSPMTGLEIVTNEVDAVPYFQGFLTGAGTPNGRVVVRP
jgi:hypothetical protein